MLPKLILASTSPRRKQLLGILGIPFTVVASDFEEDMTFLLPPKKLARVLALGKARAVAKKHQGVIIAADTIVVFRGKVLGKPRTPKRATEMLRRINGKTVSILTGLAILNTKNQKKITNVSETKIWFKKISEAEITAYVKTAEPLDRAGAFAIQDRGAIFIKKITGDFYGAMGLPLYTLAIELKKLGFTIL